MSELFFKAEDFSEFRHVGSLDAGGPRDRAISKQGRIFAEEAARIANAKLEALGTDTLTRHFLREECERLREQLNLALPELARLQALCQQQEQHGTEFAIKVVEENVRLREENEKLSNSLVPLCQHERHQILHETNICEEEKASLRSDNARLHEVLDISKLVDRFLAWQLPETVCSDPCATQRGYPHRSGTNLLTADEARQMFEHLFRAALKGVADETQPPSKETEPSS